MAVTCVQNVRTVSSVVVAKNGVTVLVEGHVTVQLVNASRGALKDDMERNAKWVRLKFFFIHTHTHTAQLVSLLAPG